MMWWLSLALGCTGDVALSPIERSFNHDENGLWARRVWLHEARTDGEAETLGAGTAGVRTALTVDAP